MREVGNGPTWDTQQKKKLKKFLTATQKQKPVNFLYFYHEIQISLYSLKTEILGHLKKIFKNIYGRTKTEISKLFDIS